MILPLMLRSQIKGSRTVLSNFADSKILRNRLGTVRFKDVFLTQSQNKGAPDGSFFGNAMSTLFSSERHRTAPGQTLVGDRTDIGQQPDGHRSNFELPSGHRAVAVRLMLSFQFNHSNRTDVNGLSDGPINRAVAVQL